ncbi:hypothetical protein EDB84DRAFT_1558079 [Lactarius hengduanensis]|nr:hypothetical protein EDB84DRAFT_1558079 [Lactarius hengduanensis]
MLHPASAPGEPASIVERSDGPVPFDAPRIVYSEDERSLEAFAVWFPRLPCLPLAHSSFVRSVFLPGSSRYWLAFDELLPPPLSAWLVPRDEGGVVDAKLNVYGVCELKVADLSAAPGNVSLSVNTYGTALVIGEKAPTIIVEELGIKFRSVDPATPK